MFGFSPWLCYGCINLTPQGHFSSDWPVNGSLPDKSQQNCVAVIVLQIIFPFYFNLSERLFLKWKLAKTCKCVANVYGFTKFLLDRQLKYKT